MEPTLHIVVLYLDDATPLEVVVSVLTHAFGLARQDAVNAVLSAHSSGEAAVLATTQPEGERLIAAALQRAAHEGCALRFALEPQAAYAAKVQQRRADGVEPRYAVPPLAVTSCFSLVPTLLGIGLVGLSLLLPWGYRQDGSSLVIAQGALAFSALVGAFSWHTWSRHRVARWRNDVQIISFVLLLAALAFCLLVRGSLPQGEPLTVTSGGYVASAGLLLVALGVFLTQVGRSGSD